MVLDDLVGISFGVIYVWEGFSVLGDGKVGCLNERGCFFFIVRSGYSDNMLYMKFGIRSLIGCIIINFCKVGRWYLNELIGD